MRVGLGYDVHRLVKDRPLVLGGVTIPADKGLDGHSDADVLIHAVMDALLGAAALGDIGRHFPDSDARYKGISSLVLLGKVTQLLAARCLSVVNMDSVVVLERPRLKDFIPRMQETMATTMGIKPEQVSIKATTTEGLGFTGTGEGIAAYAVALVEGKK